MTGSQAVYQSLRQPPIKLETYIIGAQPGATADSTGLNRAQPGPTGWETGGLSIYLDRVWSETHRLHRAQPISTGFNQSQPGSTGLDRISTSSSSQSRSLAYRISEIRTGINSAHRSLNHQGSNWRGVEPPPPTSTLQTHYFSKNIDQTGKKPCSTPPPPHLTSWQFGHCKPLTTIV